MTAADGIARDRGCRWFLFGPARGSGDAEVERRVPQGPSGHYKTTAMSRPLTILYQHHKTDAVTRRRIEGVRRLNPGVPIVPLTHGSSDVFAGTFDSAKVPGLADENGWAAADLSIYTWFTMARHGGTTADRYVFVEWDMLFRVPMTEFYREVWDVDLAGAEVYFAGPHHFWNWFRACVPLLPADLRPFAAGITPLAGVLLAHRTLQEVASRPIPNGIFSECRLGTLANASGLDPVELPYFKKRNLTWREDFVRFDKETPVYHPVKSLTDMD